MNDDGMLNIVVEGCCHGELDQIYASIKKLELESGKKVDLLLCCGDFQAVRNRGDLRSMNVPSKYLSMASFHRYYSGEAVAHVLTIFIGGNHEASNHLQELYYGGWVAPNIYYLGCSGVVSVGGVRIGGISGIYNDRDYRKGHHEIPPYTPSSIRSVYHVRQFEVFKIAQIQEPIDVFMSHDWPRGIYRHGNMVKLLRIKPYFRQECETNTLGSVAAEYLIEKLRPSYWFSGHLHCKFAALVRHNDSDSKMTTTRFLALDKCLPNRDFLQLVQVPRPAHDRGPPILRHDLEWLAILKSSHKYLSRSDREVKIPEQCKLVTSEDKEWVKKRLLDSEAGAVDPCIIKQADFVRTAPVHRPAAPRQEEEIFAATLIGNPQTDKLLALLELNHVVTVPHRKTDGGDASEGDAIFFVDWGEEQSQSSSSKNLTTQDEDPNAIDLEDVDDEIVYAPPVSTRRLVLPPPICDDDTSHHSIEDGLESSTGNKQSS